jgi:uncharacterized membrane protein (UPF0127 family)
VLCQLSYAPGLREHCSGAIVGEMARRITTVRRSDGVVVCARCLVADGPWLRMKGLLGRASLPDDEGVLLEPAASIHMFFMRFAIDAVFLDRELRVVHCVSDLRPWRLAGKRGARSVLEVAAGTVARVGLRDGDQLVLGD